MRIKDVASVLDAEILCRSDLVDTEVKSACGSDMMSDVLAYVKDHAVLLTGLVNPQVVRTAEMMDMKCIVFVRGKNPSEQIIALAEEAGIVLMRSAYRMYTSCGLLYASGLKNEGSDMV